VERRPPERVAAVNLDTQLREDWQRGEQDVAAAPLGGGVQQRAALRLLTGQRCEETLFTDGVRQRAALRRGEGGAAAAGEEEVTQCGGAAK